MLPNPLSSAAADSEAATRPQLRLAARAESHPDTESTPLTAGIQEAVQRSHRQWRGSLDAVREALSVVERNCESAIETQEAEVAALLETLLARAAADADAAAQRAHAEAQAEIAELQRGLSIFQTIVATLQNDLDAERASVTSLQARLDAEVAARERAETERDEARRNCQQQTAAAEAQAAALRSEGEAQRAELALALQQLDSAIDERAKLTATFQMVQRALALGVAENMAVPTEGPVPRAPGATNSVPAQAPVEKTATPAPVVAPTTVADPRAALADRHPEVIEDVKRVLEQVEAMHQLDLNSGRPGVEVVASLTRSLQYARDMVLGRWSASCDAETLFEYQVDLLLHTQAGTFGRHLSIAAYDSRKGPASSDHAHPGTGKNSQSA